MHALIANASVAALFAVTFASIRISYPAQRDVLWFVAMYAVGMLTPLCELGVRLTEWTTPFMIGSYASFLLCMTFMSIGIAAVAGRPRPWRTAVAIVVAGAVIRTAIWGGPRGALWYELSYQAPFAAAAATSTFIAARSARATRGRLWSALAVALSVLTGYFFAKPFVANAFGSGRSPRDYAASAYALFSQATGGVLIVTAGLLVLLLVVQKAMGRTIAESETDPLTGLANRRGFERRAARIIAAAGATSSPVTAILFDLDHFKRVNDGYGHATGDAVLRAFAAALRETLPADAAIARLGGEEFVAVLDRTTLRGAWLAAQAVRAALPAMGAHLPTVTVSGGLADLRPGDTLALLIERADAWSYAAKQAGRNRIFPMPDPVDADPMCFADAS